MYIVIFIQIRTFTIEIEMFNIQEIKTGEQDSSEGKKVENYYYQLSDLVGKGNFSQVYKGIDTLTRKPVAIKVVKNSSLTSTVAMQLLKNEITILKQLDHDNVVRCLDVFVSKNNHYIVTDFYEGGDLEKLIQRKVYLEEKAVARIVYEIYRGLVYLNQHSIVHRDLKPANIFLTASGVPKIADFGFAVKYHKIFKDINIGSPIYMSPEGLLKKQYGPKTEVWAFGVLVYEMLHGYTPLSKCQSEAELREKVVMPPVFRSGISSELRNMIELCLTVNEKQRIEVKQIANTPYMKRLIFEFEGAKSKDLASTLATTTASIAISSSSSINPAQTLAEQVKTYEDGLALLHYCRLIHKTSQETPSYIFSQWLLNLCWSLQKIKLVAGDKEQNQNLMTTIHNYWLKYYEDHKSKGLIISFADIKTQCQQQLQKLKSSFNSSTTKLRHNNLSMLLRQSELLQKFGQAYKLPSYTKSTQVEKYLDSIKHGKNGHSSGSTGAGHASMNVSAGGLGNTIGLGNGIGLGNYYGFNK